MPLRFPATLLLLSLTLGGACAAAEIDVTSTAAFGWTSRVEDRGVAITGSALSGKLALAAGGFHGDLAAAEALRHGQGGVTTVAAGYDWKPGDIGPTLGVGVRREDFSAVPAGATRATTEIGLVVGGSPRADWKPTLAWWHELRRHADTLEAGLAMEWPLPKIGSYLQTGLVAGGVRASNLLPDHAGAPVKDSYLYGGLDMKLPYRILGTRWAVVLTGHWTATTGQNPAWSPLRETASSQLAGAVELSLEF